MHHHIRPGLHYARTGTHTLFLDAHANRYFCLSPGAEPDIERLELGQALSQDSELIRAGLVVPAEQPFRSPVLPIVAQKSVLDCAMPAGVRMTASVLSRFMIARMSLAWAPARVLTRGANTERETDSSGHEARLRRLAGAYLAASRIAGSHDKCLAWSLALARLCRRRGLPAICIIGVAARPFAAHSWVQIGDRLLNDRFDTVRNFTPILAL